MTTLETPVQTHPGFDALRPLLHPERHLWTPGELRDLTTTVSTGLSADLRRILRFSGEQRWWARLGLTDGVELWLLSWLPGQFTEPHDHGGASGSFTVLLGDLDEQYRYPGTPIRDRRHPAGAAVGFGAGHAHQVRNNGPAPAASVHAYSPPLVPTREYATLWDVPDSIPDLTGSTITP
jgi:hypothetical protein